LKKSIKIPYVSKIKRDIWPKRLYTTKEEASSLSVLHEALMLSCAMYAKEIRYDIVKDIPGAFFNADMEGIVHMIFEEKITELIFKLKLET